MRACRCFWWIVGPRFTGPRPWRTKTKIFSLRKSSYIFSKFNLSNVDTHSLQATPLFGGYREKWTRERHARGDAKAGGGGEKGSPFLGSSRLASLAQIGELARIYICRLPRLRAVSLFFLGPSSGTRERRKWPRVLFWKQEMASFLGPPRFLRLAALLLDTRAGVHSPH